MASTMRILVALAFELTTLMSLVNSAQIDLFTTASLSQPRQGMASASVGSLILFAGGASNGIDSAQVDMFDTATSSWSTAQLSVARTGLAGTSVGVAAIFAGGNTANGPVLDTVDIFYADTESWKQAKLSEARSSLAATSVGKYALFGGGVPADEIVSSGSSRVDIYDCVTGGWTTAELSVARSILAAVSVGQVAIFAGGLAFGETDTVDIFNSNSLTWSTAQLSEARSSLAAAAANGKAVFCGGSINGRPTDTIDIYDSTTQNWSVGKLSSARMSLSATGSGQFIFVGGGRNMENVASQTVDVLDTTTMDWTNSTAYMLSEAREGAAAASASCLVLFAGGQWMTAGTQGDSATIDIFTVSPCASPANTTAQRCAVSPAGSNDNPSDKRAVIIALAVIGSVAGLVFVAVMLYHRRDRVRTACRSCCGNSPDNAAVSLGENPDGPTSGNEQQAAAVRNTERDPLYP